MYEPNAVAEWLGGYPASEQTDKAKLAFANTISHDDMASALDRAQRIQNPEERLATSERLAKRWAKADRPAALDALANAQLSDASKAAIAAELK